jgi:hypothetical protein
MASPLLVSFFLGKEARLAAFRPFALSHFREAGVAVCGDAVHAPHEVFSTVVPSMGAESDGQARERGARSAFHTAR